MTNPLLRGLVDLLRPSVQRPCVLTASRRTVIMPADLPTLQRSPMPRQRLSSTGRYGTSERTPDHSGLMPANWITFAHFSDSVATKAPKSAALKIIGMVPSSASRDLMVGFASPALILMVEACNDLWGRAFWHTNSCPRPGLVPRNRLGNSRHLRQHVKSIAARYAERPQRAGAHVRQRCHHHIESNLHLPSD